MNECAVENVKNAILQKMRSAEKAEKQAKDEGGRVQSQIDMYHDEFMLWAGFLAQL